MKRLGVQIEETRRENEEKRAVLNGILKQISEKEEIDDTEVVLIVSKQKKTSLAANCCLVGVFIGIVFMLGRIQLK